MYACDVSDMYAIYTKMSDLYKSAQHAQENVAFTILGPIVTWPSCVVA